MSNRMMQEAVILEMAISEYAMYVRMYCCTYDDHASLMCQVKVISNSFNFAVYVHIFKSQ